MQTKLSAQLQLAKANGYAVPAFNFDNLEMLKAIIESAEEAKAPVIVMASEGAIKYMGVEFTLAIGKAARDSANVPVVFHLDHGTDLDVTKAFIKGGVDSVMLDWSLKTIAENIAGTKKVVQWARAHGVEVESEIGHVGGKEDDRDSKVNHFTSLAEAQTFTHAVDIDALAIAVGSQHGIYKTAAKLQFDRISEISNALDVPLVLHGSSGISYNDVQQAIRCGISKVNIGTDIKIANAQAVREWLNTNPSKYDARKFGRTAINAMKIILHEKIRMCLAEHKA